MASARSSFRGAQMAFVFGTMCAMLKASCSGVGVFGYDHKARIGMLDPNVSINLIPGGGNPDPGRRVF
jgi:hypothetical protein